ncbi:MAG TPA: flavodoxin [Lachnoclostridium sp.]|uniref:flavodoxin n=1 Tax=Lacrimispora sp. TaxID=2719234 RepID=UPI000ECF9C12|nr:flavodoxin [Lacrimispora sp.]HCD43598.1 flavodoxin [Lachnoclostridium sp.]
MSKIAVVYWSGTGNTEAMAAAVLEGIKEKGADGLLLTSSEFDASMIDSLDAIAFGCPAMGAEVLEESEFEPMFTSCQSGLGGKRVALFGSYGWGDGEWMRSWEKTCEEAGIELACDSVICNEAPDGEAVAACKALGATLAE